MQKVSFALCLDFEEGIRLSGELAMSLTDIPARASRQVSQDTDYDDKLDNTPRSALRYRSTNTDDLEPPISPRRIVGQSRVLLYVLLLLCVAFLISGINAPMLAGNVVTLHIPFVWLVGLLAISVISVMIVRSR